MLPEKLQVLGKISVPFKSVGWQRPGYWPRWRGCWQSGRLKALCNWGWGHLRCRDALHVALPSTSHPL